jgi:mannose-6-phosphate isomerase-like protein (cupin superfamily)
MDVKQIIDSGILEEYVLGLLDEKQAVELTTLLKTNPLLEEEVSNIEKDLMKAHKIQPQKELFSMVEEKIALIQEEEYLNLENLPLIHKYSDHRRWNTLLMDVGANESMDRLDVNILKNTNEVTLYLAWLKDDLMEDGHDTDEFKESFFILEGSCECNFDGKIFTLQAGDFIDIPHKTKHSFKNTSTDLAYVKALIQRVKIAV